MKTTKDPREIPHCLRSQVWAGGLALRREHLESELFTIHGKGKGIKRWHINQEHINQEEEKF